MVRFFIPDVEYLIDPKGLVGYVEKKVKLGKICLYCNGKGKAFHTYRALQQVRIVSSMLASNVSRLICRSINFLVLPANTIDFSHGRKPG